MAHTHLFQCQMYNPELASINPKYRPYMAIYTFEYEYDLSTYGQAAGNGQVTAPARGRAPAAHLFINWGRCESEDQRDNKVLGRFRIRPRTAPDVPSTSQTVPAASPKDQSSKLEHIIN